MSTQSTTETTCHCAAPFNGSDHCPECGCEQFEAYCDHIWDGTTPRDEFGCAMTDKQYHAVNAVISAVHAAGPTTSHEFVGRESGPYYYTVQGEGDWVRIYVGATMRKITVMRDGRVF